MSISLFETTFRAAAVQSLPHCAVCCTDTSIARIHVNKVTPDPVPRGCVGARFQLSPHDLRARVTVRVRVKI